MAILPPNLNSTQIKGTISMGYKDKPELQEFCEYYYARIEMTDRLVYKQQPGTVQVGSHTTMLRPDIAESEKIVGIYMPQTMMAELTMNHARMMDEANVRRKNPVLMDMWDKYQTMLHLLK